MTDGRGAFVHGAPLFFIKDFIIFWYRKSGMCPFNMHEYMIFYASIPERCSSGPWEVPVSGNSGLDDKFDIELYST